MAGGEEADVNPDDLRPVGIAELWRRGDLWHRLHAGQRDLLAWSRALPSRKQVWDCARRYGKSTLLCVMALEHCIRTPGARVVYAAPTRDQARTIVLPLMAEICAEGGALAPRWSATDHAYLYDDGRMITLDGADDERGNHLRGPKATLVLCDEAGFWRYPQYVINSVLLPQTLTCDGKVVIASTPPESLGHEYWEFVVEAKSQGAYARRTIHDNPMVTPALLAEYARESGGEGSTTWRREYLCEAVTEASRAVVPEFSVLNVLELVRPAKCAKYVAMDLGLVDSTHILFAYYDFTAATIVVEDEHMASYETTEQLAAAVRAKEAALWGGEKPKRRVADNDAQQLHDLTVTHGLHFAPAAKHDSEAALNRMREMVAQKRIIINQRCAKLIHQLRVGIWNAARTDYERLPGAGHLDGVDALKYLVRSVDYQTNPFAETRPRGRSDIADDVLYAYAEKRRGGEWAKLLPKQLRGT